MTDEHFTAETGIPADSRFLDGHFPGNPIVPGAMILAWLADRLAISGRAIERVERMKFTRPLGPATPFEVILKSGTQAEFRTTDGMFARARLVLRSGDG
ncbi:MAG: hypothetical protein AB8B85_17560 [Paracoccaceae bacterium]